MATMEMPKEATQQEGYEMADEVMSRIGGLDDVETVGAISGGMSMSSSSSGSTYSFYILLKENGRTLLQRPNGGINHRSYPGSGL